MRVRRRRTTRDDIDNGGSDDSWESDYSIDSWKAPSLHSFPKPNLHNEHARMHTKQEANIQKAHEGFENFQQSMVHPRSGDPDYSQTPLSIYIIGAQKHSNKYGKQTRMHVCMVCFYI
eukprot:GHVU01173771.1.p2 GENE.GHVU01173771.1~~GHVU01173771.1.p2  ORF type:complete len:118 (-),score=5.61 GHVU01173771.1:120-473(-)